MYVWGIAVIFGIQRRLRIEDRLYLKIKGKNLYNDICKII